MSGLQTAMTAKVITPPTAKEFAAAAAAKVSYSKKNTWELVCDAGNAVIDRFAQVLLTLEEKILLKIEPIPLWQKNTGYDFRVAGIPLPTNADVTHMLFLGLTGTGKSVLLMEQLDQIREFKQRAIVSDPKYAFICKYFRKDVDYLFNPSDKKGCDWNVWCEIPWGTIYEPMLLQQYVAAWIPVADGENAWVGEGAQAILKAAVCKLYELREHCNNNLYDRLVPATNEDICIFLAGTAAAGYLNPKPDSSQMQAYRGALATALAPIRLIKDANPVSIRNLVRDESRDSWIFFGFTSEDRDFIKNMVTLWTEIAIRAGLALPDTSSTNGRRIHFVLDEFADFPKCAAILPGLNQGRSKGLAFKLGLQVYAQVKPTYGEDDAVQILAGAKTKIILNSDETETKEYLAKLIGQVEEDVRDESLSDATSDERDSRSLSSKMAPRDLVMASEIGELPERCGYLKTPRPYGVKTWGPAYFEAQWKKRDDISPGFEPVEYEDGVKQITKEAAAKNAVAAAVFAAAVAPLVENPTIATSAARTQSPASGADQTDELNELMGGGSRFFRKRASKKLSKEQLYRMTPDEIDAYLAEMEAEGDEDDLADTGATVRPGEVQNSTWPEGGL